MCMPHASGDEPDAAAQRDGIDMVCPTRVGMNRLRRLRELHFDEYAPREWG